MSCNHFLVFDCDGLVAPDTAGLCVCTECGMATNIPMEIEIAKEADRYVGPDHPDYSMMLTEAHFALQRALVRFEGEWKTGGSCTPITEPPTEPVPSTEWQAGGTARKLDRWESCKAWIKRVILREGV
jgi:hypothetical protein